MRRILFVSALLIFLCVSSFVLAFDNHRQGFLIGGLGGIAMDNWQENELSGTNLALHTDFRVGGGFEGDNLMLYYWNIVNWFTIKEPYVKDTTINGITGIGVSYYLKPTSPSLYFNTGIGVSTWVRGIEGAEYAYGDGSRSFGFGLAGGIGFEFVRHWSVELGVMYGSASSSVAGTLSLVGIAY